MKIYGFTILLFFSLMSCFAQNHWHFITGLPLATAFSMESDGQGNVFMGETSGGLYKTSDNDTAWHSAGLEGKYITALALDSQSNIYAGTQLDGLLRSSDNSETYDSIGLSNRFINNIIIPSAGFLIIATDTGIYTSTDNAQNLTLIGPSGKNITSVFFDDQNNIYTFATPGIYVSPDTGRTWQSISTGLPQECNAIFMYLSKTNGLFAGTEFCGLYKFDHVAASWNHYALDSLHVTSMDENSQNQLFASTYNGPLFSNDGGLTWDTLGNRLERDNLARIFINSTDFAYINICCGYGFYRTEFSTTDPQNIDEPSCSELCFMEFACYPNPFSETSQIFFTLNKSDLVTVTFYNTTGIKIKETSGYYSSNERNIIPLADTDLPDGVYIIALETKKQRVFQKIIKI